jgi:hypothetical protein
MTAALRMTATRERLRACAIKTRVSARARSRCAPPQETAKQFFPKSKGYEKLQKLPRRKQVAETKVIAINTLTHVRRPSRQLSICSFVHSFRSTQVNNLPAREHRNSSPRSALSGPLQRRPSAVRSPAVRRKGLPKRGTTNDLAVTSTSFFPRKGVETMETIHANAARFQRRSLPEPAVPPRQLPDRDRL